MLLRDSELIGNISFFRATSGLFASVSGRFPWLCGAIKPPLTLRNRPGPSALFFFFSLLFPTHSHHDIILQTNILGIVIARMSGSKTYLTFDLCPKPILFQLQPHCTHRTLSPLPQITSFPKSEHETRLQLSLVRALALIPSTIFSS